MMARYHASKLEILMSEIRYFFHYNLPDVLAGIAIVTFIILLPIIAALFAGI